MFFESRIYHWLTGRLAVCLYTLCLCALVFYVLGRMPKSRARQAPRWAVQDGRLCLVVPASGMLTGIRISPGNGTEGAREPYSWLADMAVEMMPQPRTHAQVLENPSMREYRPMGTLHVLKGQRISFPWTDLPPGFVELTTWDTARNAFLEDMD